MTNDEVEIATAIFDGLAMTRLRRSYAVAGQINDKG